jgi:zinc protease
MGVSATKDNVSISLRVLKKDLEKGFGLFMDVLTASIFPEDELQKEVKKILGAIQSSEEQPMEVAEQAFDKALFPDGPYGHPVEGSQESVARFNNRDVAGFYKTHYHPNNAVLAVVGDISLEEVKTRLVPLLLTWPASETAKPTFNPAFAKRPEPTRINRDIAQANIIIGSIGVERANPDFYALTVMNYILGGGGFGSRLMEEIRVKRGLAYSVSSFFDAKKYSGSFQVVLQTKNASAKEAISLALKQIEIIRQEPVSEEALQRAQNYLVGSFPLRFDTQGELAGFLTQIEYYGLGLDYAEKYPTLIKGVSREDVLRVSRTYLHPEQAFLVIVGNLKEAGMETPRVTP